MIFFLFSLISLVLAQDIDETHVKVLTQDNFHSIVDEAELALVEFYAPWCGHCKKLAPEFALAADALSGDGIILAKVDVTEERDLGVEFEIKGYPTLKVWKNGKISDYNGPRQASGIVKFMRSQHGDASKSLESVSDLDTFVENAENVKFVAYANSEKSQKIWHSVAESLREEYIFAIVSDSEVAKSRDVAADAIVAYRPKHFLVGEKKFAGEWNEAEIRKFVVENAVPLAGVYTPTDASKYQLAGLPRLTLWTRVDEQKTAKQNTYYLNRLRKVAKEFQGKLLFALEDKVAAREFADLGFDDTGDYGLGVVAANGSKYKLAVDEKFSVALLRSFAQAFVDGKVERYIKSEPVPEANDEAVVTVVGSQFEELVHDTSKDVLIEFYAPWCGHCKSLAPKYEKLARSMQKYDSVRIAKIDATANDHSPIYQVSGFPTIFLQKNDGSDPIKYEGDRTAKAMRKFVKKNASRKLVEKKEEL